MWCCRKCGEGIDDVFDACWKCGTEKPGLRPDEDKEKGQLDAGDLRRQKIVELCSAGNVAEAYAIQDLLQDAGIRSRVVGEFLGAAAGALPLGETVSPRIWVLRKRFGTG